MRVNKYIIKYTVPKQFGTNNIFYSFVEIYCGNDDKPKEFRDSLCRACVEDFKKYQSVSIEAIDIDFQLISLVDMVVK